MLCRLCNTESEKRFDGLIRGAHVTSYFVCPGCGFVQTGDPVWLEEAYREPINACDTGILRRNEEMRQVVSVLLYHFFDPGQQYLDYAGGYGLFTRLMRDVGFDFYWSDKYADNIFAKGFEHWSGPVEAITAFEVFEHLADPVSDLEKMLAISRNLIFTTELVPDPVPAPDQWWYYGIEHGQHISFYTKTSLERLAARFGLNYYSFRQLHVMTEKKLSPLKLKLVSKCLRKLHLFERTRKRMTTKTEQDMSYVLSLQGKS